MYHRTTAFRLGKERAESQRHPIPTISVSSTRGYNWSCSNGRQNPHRPSLERAGYGCAGCRRSRALQSERFERHFRGPGEACGEIQLECVVEIFETLLEGRLGSEVEPDMFPCGRLEEESYQAIVRVFLKRAAGHF